MAPAHGRPRLVRGPPAARTRCPVPRGRAPWGAPQEEGPCPARLCKSSPAPQEEGGRPAPFSEPGLGRFQSSLFTGIFVSIVTSAQSHQRPRLAPSPRACWQHPWINAASAGPLCPKPHCLPGEAALGGPLFGELLAASPRAPKAKEPSLQPIRPSQPWGRPGHQGPLGPAPALTLLLVSPPAQWGGHPTSHLRSGAGDHSHICHRPPPPSPAWAPCSLLMTPDICHLLRNLLGSFSVLIVPPSPHPNLTRRPLPPPGAQDPKVGEISSLPRADPDT